MLRHMSGLGQVKKFKLKKNFDDDWQLVEWSKVNSKSFGKPHRSKPELCNDTSLTLWIIKLVSYIYIRLFFCVRKNAYDGVLCHVSNFFLFLIKFNYEIASCFIWLVVRLCRWSGEFYAKISSLRVKCLEPQLPVAGSKWKTSNFWTTNGPWRRYDYNVPEDSRRKLLRDQHFRFGHISHILSVVGCG